jgi:hypothetical protein
MDKARGSKPEDEFFREVLALHLFCRFLGFSARSIRFAHEPANLVIALDVSPVALRLSLTFDEGNRRTAMSESVVEEAKAVIRAWNRKVRDLSAEKRGELESAVMFGSKIADAFPAFLLQIVSAGIEIPNRGNEDIDDCVSSLLRIAKSKVTGEISHLSIAERDVLAIWTLFRVGGVPEDSIAVSIEGVSGKRMLCVKIRWKRCSLGIAVAFLPDNIAEECVVCSWRRNLEIYKQVPSSVRAILVAESRLTGEFPLLVQGYSDIDMPKVVEYVATARGEQGIS